MGHPQPNTPIHCNNATAVGIANNTIKRQRSRSMEMRFFWVRDKIAQEMYDLQWHPWQENLADYQSKHHIRSHHAAVRPWYLHMENPPGYYRLGLILGGSLFYARVTFETLVVFNFKVP